MRALTAFAAALVACARTGPSEADRKAVAEAAAALRRGEFAVAQKARLPDQAAALRLRGLAHLRAGDAQAAVRDLRRARDRAPLDGDIGVDLARALLAAGRADQAREAFEAASLAPETSPFAAALAAGGFDPAKTARALAALGKRRLRAGESEAALALFAEAAVLDPGDADLRVHLGSALYNLRDYARAAEEFTRATRLDPTAVGAWKLSGHAHKLLGRAEEAELAYRRVLQLRPGDPDALAALGVPAAPPAPAAGPPLPPAGPPQGVVAPAAP